MENKQKAADSKGNKIDSEKLENVVGTSNTLCLHGFSMNYLNELKDINKKIQNKDDSVTEKEIELVEKMGQELLEMKYLVRGDNSKAFGKHFLGLDNRQSGSLLLSSPLVAFGIHGGPNVGSFDNYFSWITSVVIECLNQAAHEWGLV